MSDRRTVLKNEFGHLQLQPFGDEWMVHLELYKWSADCYKAYLVVFEQLMLEMKEQGVNRVFVLIPATDKKLIKFEKMFGFQPLHEQDDMLLMYRETGE